MAQVVDAKVKLKAVLGRATRLAHHAYAGRVQSGRCLQAQGVGFGLQACWSENRSLVVQRGLLTTPTPGQWAEGTRWWGLPA